MTTVTAFTPWASLAGGMLIGLSAVLLMAFEGRIAGISGIIGRLLPPVVRGDRAGSLAFLVGLVAAPFAYAALSGVSVSQTVSDNPVLMATAGALVGVGVALGNGCTSGHGVCGLSRLSPRSLVATLTFMVVAMATVFIVRHILGGLA